MSTSNRTQFLEAAAADPVLGEKVRALQSEPADVAAEKLSELAREAGFSVTAAEFLGLSEAGGELSDEDLNQVAGGMLMPGNANSIGHRDNCDTPL